MQVSACSARFGRWDACTTIGKVISPQCLIRPPVSKPRARSTAPAWAPWRPASRTSSCVIGVPTTPAAALRPRRSQDLDAGMASHDGLGCGGHPHHVGTQRSQHPDLGRGLVTRPRHAGVDPGCQINPQAMRLPPRLFPAAPSSRPRSCREIASPDEGHSIPAADSRRSG